MGYFCYIFSPRSAVPHMEALESDNLNEAKAYSGRLLAEHASGLRAELYDGDRRVAVISREEAREAP